MCMMMMMISEHDETIRAVLRDLVDKVAANILDDEATIGTIVRDMVDKVANEHEVDVVKREEVIAASSLSSCLSSSQPRLEILAEQASYQLDSNCEQKIENSVRVDINENLIFRGDNIDDLLKMVDYVESMPLMPENIRKRKIVVDKENTFAADGLMSLKRARLNSIANELSQKAEIQEPYIVSAKGHRRALGDITNTSNNAASTKLPEFRIKAPKLEALGLYMDVISDDYDVYSVRESKSVQVEFDPLLETVYDEDDDRSGVYVDDLGMTVSLATKPIQLGGRDYDDPSPILSSQMKPPPSPPVAEEPLLDENNNVIDAKEQFDETEETRNDENDDYLEIPILEYKGVDLLSIKAPNKKDQANTESFYAYHVARQLYSHDELVNGLFDDTASTRKRASKKQTLNDHRVDILKEAIQLKFGYSAYEKDNVWSNLRSLVNKRIRCLKPKKD